MNDSVSQHLFAVCGAVSTGVSEELEHQSSEELTLDAALLNNHEPLVLLY
jgi:hypothetical protein